MMKYRVLTMALLAAFSISASARTVEAEIVDRIVASVNDDVITLSDFYTAVPIFIQLNQINPAALGSVEGRRLIATRVMQELVNRCLLDQEANQHELQVERSAVDGFIERMAQQSGLSSEDLRMQLRTAGIRYDDFYEYLRLELTKLRVINVMVSSGVSVSDDEVNAVFTERYPEGAVETHYDVSQILLTLPRDGNEEDTVAAETLASSLIEQLDAGADFAELASEHSTHSSRIEGGHMGTYQRGQLPQDFETVIFGLTPGQYSRVFATRFGLHIVLLHNRWEESTIDVDRIRETIYRELQQEKTNRSLEQFMAGLHDDSIVQIVFDPTTLF